jgi:hypothetical protein
MGGASRILRDDLDGHMQSNHPWTVVAGSVYQASPDSLGEFIETGDVCGIAGWTCVHRIAGQAAEDAEDSEQSGIVAGFSFQSQKKELATDFTDGTDLHG